MIFQQFNLLDQRTVLKNVELAGELFKEQNIKERALKYLNLADDLIYIITAGTVITIRILAVVKKWSFPPKEMRK